MALMPLLNGILDMVESEFGAEVSAQVKFYVDDGNIAAPHHVMLRIIEYLIEEGPKVGYEINKNKGCFLMGRADSTAQKCF